jgi:hypothetical protein
MERLSRTLTLLDEPAAAPARGTTPERERRLPIYRHFFVERRMAAGWGVPPDFAPEPWTFDCDRPFGGFAWAHPGIRWLALFWGAEALFPMRPGPPDDRRGSALLEYLDQFYDYGRDEDELCWLPYSDLMIDNWDTEWVTVGARVPARYALLFEDGRQSFPTAALLGTGASEIELERLRDGSLGALLFNIGSGPRVAKGNRHRRRLAYPSDRFHSSDGASPLLRLGNIAAELGPPHSDPPICRRYGRNFQARNPKQISMAKRTKSETPTHDPAQRVWSIGIWSFGFVWDSVFRAWCFGCGFAALRDRR